MKRGGPFLGLAIVGVTSLLVSCGSDESGGIRASGTVEATDADLGFQQAGRIESILVREGDSVQSGQEVAVLDRKEVLARRRSAEAQGDAARALLSEMEAGSRDGEIGEGRAALTQAEERRDDALRDRDRAQRLFDGGSISQEVLDKSATAFRVSEAAVDQARQRLQMLVEGVRPERIAAQRALVAQADAAVAQIDAALSNAVVVVPFDGLITVRHREPGETVSPGIPVLTLMDPEDRWVRIYVREDRIGEVRVGQAATISSDTYPDRVYQGEVVFIASEAEFTPRNVQTTEERVKLVYAVKVRITGDPSHDLKPGIPADVSLDESSPAGTEG
ncbi:MAG: HlyD family efflux transporter periplasmic adaptor subunit [Gemmatimonadetes bacterium]|nr:HlyD family efflux transporter periplasmic adaptor subunit [Gemmatimonadota bacterium]NNM04235.1 HlyD family efflux transporter periplasmic adaptor subunit [Gemmatimonadota bacterium]